MRFRLRTLLIVLAVSAGVGIGAVALLYSRQIAEAACDYVMDRATRAFYGGSAPLTLQ
jgi:hypothetical protein